VALGDDEIGHSQMESKLAQWQKDGVCKHGNVENERSLEKNVLWWRKKRGEAGHKTVTLHLQLSSCLVPARLLEHQFGMVARASGLAINKRLRLADDPSPDHIITCVSHGPTSASCMDGCGRVLVLQTPGLSKQTLLTV